MVGSAPAAPFSSGNVSSRLLPIGRGIQRPLLPDDAPCTRPVSTSGARGPYHMAYRPMGVVVGREPVYMMKMCQEERSCV